MIDPFAAYDMSGKVAVLTGGASGIGEASAELIAGAGGAVVLGDIDGKWGREGHAAHPRQQQSRGGPTTTSRRRPMSTRWSIAAWPSSAGSTRWAILGVMNADLVIDITEAEFDRIVAINMKGVLWGCQAALRVMMPQGSGSIVNISSAAIDYPNSNVSLYAMTKAAVAMLTMELAIEAGPHGVRVNCLAPGQTATNFGRYLWETTRARSIPTSGQAMYNAVRACPPSVVWAKQSTRRTSCTTSLPTRPGLRPAPSSVNGGVGIVW